MNIEIETYLKQSPRNKIVISSKKVEDIKYVDVGRELSELLIEISPTKHFALHAKAVLQELLISKIQKHQKFGPILALENLGILIEKELKLDFSTFLDNFSKENALFLKWEGDRDRDFLYFLSRNTGVKINITNLSHIII